MRFYKEVWGIIWEFNSIGEYVSFCIGRLLGVIIFFGGIYLLIKCSSSDATTEQTTSDYEPIPVSFYQYDED
jgi:NADH:ubiquinone oxidoreductase subunit H